MNKQSFLDRFLERAESLDPLSRQTYILKLSKERGFFETIFNSIEEGILIVDRQLHIKYFNIAAKALLNLPADLDEVRLSQFLPDVNWRRILSQDADEWLRVSRQEIEILYPESRFVQFCLVPLVEDPSMAAVVIRDVSNERMQVIQDFDSESNKQLAMLAGSVAHEIGNPLNSLYLNLQLLERATNHKTDLTPDETREMISACRSEVERLDGIITQFLGAIRPREMVYSQVYLDKLLLEVLNFMRQELELKKILTKCDVPENIPFIMGDEKQLKQLFYNIIRNAIQATRAHGSLSIKISADSEFVLIEFADSGRGIDSSQINRIFAPFQSFKQNGNGLGMMIVERIVREHGAEIAIDSEANVGTIVSIRFRRHTKKMRVLPVAD